MRGHAASGQRKLNKHWQSSKKSFKLWLAGIQGYMTSYESPDIEIDVLNTHAVGGSTNSFSIYVYEANTEDFPQTGYNYFYSDNYGAYIVGGCYNAPKYTAGRRVQILGGVVDPLVNRITFAAAITDGGCYVSYYDSSGNFIGRAQLTEYQISLRYAHLIPPIQYYETQAEYLADPYMPPHTMTGSQVWWTPTSDGHNKPLLYQMPIRLAFTNTELAELNKYPCFITGQSRTIMENLDIQFTDTLTPPAGTARREYRSTIKVKVGFGIA